MAVVSARELFEWFKTNSLYGYVVSQFEDEDDYTSVTIDSSVNLEKLADAINSGALSSAPLDPKSKQR